MGLGFGVWGLGFGVWGLGFTNGIVEVSETGGTRPFTKHAQRVTVWGLGFGGLGFGVWGLGFGVWGLGFGVWGLGFECCSWCFVFWGLGFGTHIVLVEVSIDCACCLPVRLRVWG